MLTTCVFVSVVCLLSSGGGAAVQATYPHWDDLKGDRWEVTGDPHGWISYLLIVYTKKRKKKGKKRVQELSSETSESD